MTGEQRKIIIKDVIMCSAFFWAYQEYARSQQLGDTYVSTPLHEMTDGLWERLKQSEKAPPMIEEHKKLFHLLFEKEFKIIYFLLENERDDMIEQTEKFFKKIGYNPEVRVTRE